MSEEYAANLTKKIEALKNGDRVAFEQVYYDFGPKLYAFTQKLVPGHEEAQEVVQEVFIKLWECKHFLDPQKNFDAYLFKIARNLVYNKARRHVYALAYSKYLKKEEVVSKRQTEEDMDFQELNQLLEETYASLPTVRRQVFIMSRIDGMTNTEIAQELQTSNSNIENHIHKALRDIRLKLKTYKIIYTISFLFFTLNLS